MVIAVRTEELDGDLVVVKEARTSGDVARLSREANLLGRARHPGVVDLRAVADRSISLGHGGTALSRLGPFPLHEAAGIVSSLADTVHALHHAGVVHGDIDPEHVVLDGRGHPRLCGFGQASEHSSDGAADDVAALGRLLRKLSLAGIDLDTPGGRRQRRRSRRDVEALADQATQSDRERRPTARQLAKALHASVPDMTLPTAGSTVAAVGATGVSELPDDDPTADLGWTLDELSYLGSEQADSAEEGLTALDGRADVEHDLTARIEAPIVTADDGPGIALPDSAEDSDAPSSARWTRLPLARVALGGVLLTVGIVGGVMGARAVDPFGGDASAVSSPTTTPAPPAQETPSTSAGLSATPPTWPARCGPVDLTGPDVNGDGCPELVVLDGRTAEIGSITIEVGQDGDLITLGDWSCDGIQTPALLRPQTGEIFVFLEWHLDEPAEITALTAVEGARSIDATTDLCPTPIVTTPDGAVRVTIDR